MSLFKPSFGDIDFFAHKLAAILKRLVAAEELGESERLKLAEVWSSTKQPTDTLIVLSAAAAYIRDNRLGVFRRHHFLSSLHAELLRLAIDEDRCIDFTDRIEELWNIKRRSLRAAVRPQAKLLSD